jgi:hypothetical protein
MAACQRGSDEHFAGPAGQVFPAGDSLEWNVARARSTRHIESSMLETKDAKPGNEFVVLDVRVRNPGTQPQVVSEGSLISVDASQPQSFATPVSMLADEFLTLQVLAPGATVRGKIAYEVPEGLAGVFYWTPGTGARRILVRVEAAPEAPRTSAIAVAPPATSQGDRKAQTAPAKPLVARAIPSAKTRPHNSKPRHQATVISAAQEQARRDRCEALLSGNVPMDEGSRPFYLLNCPDYPLPSSWSAATTAASVEAPRPPPPPSGCSRNTSRAGWLVCNDPYLATLDRRLAQSLSRALRVADDPASLQREQADWRARVRDACSTIRCLELAYGRRTAHIDAVGKVGP